MTDTQASLSLKERRMRGQAEQAGRRRQMAQGRIDKIEPDKGRGQMEQGNCAAGAAEGLAAALE